MRSEVSKSRGRQEGACLASIRYHPLGRQRGTPHGSSRGTASNVNCDCIHVPPTSTLLSECRGKGTARRAKVKRHGGAGQHLVLTCLPRYSRIWTFCSIACGWAGHITYLEHNRQVFNIFFLSRGEGIASPQLPVHNSFISSKSWEEKAWPVSSGA